MADLPVVLSRMMGPDNANSRGNVHGGEILKLMEEAGHIVATRHCNKVKAESDPPKLAILARVEQMDFLKPIFIGNVVHLTAVITFVSRRSLEVRVNVWAEDIFTRERRFSNRGTLWYVAVTMACPTEYKIASVPPFEGHSSKDIEEGQKRFERQQKERQASKEQYKRYESGELAFEDWNNEVAVGQEIAQHTVKRSQSTLIHSVLPSDCYATKYCTGGSIMKLMDTAAALAAIRHTNTACVTASIDAINFHHPMRLANVITFSSRVTFVSSKSIEVEVMVIAEDLRTGKKHFSCSAFFNFVSVDSDSRVLPVPPLTLKTDSERERFADGNKRYLIRKQRRTSTSTDKT